jgi:predicted RNase H-like HicB family nuclease
MTNRYTAITDGEGDGFVALCPELEVASPGDTVAEAPRNLRRGTVSLLLVSSP